MFILREGEAKHRHILPVGVGQVGQVGTFVVKELEREENKSASEGRRNSPRSSDAGSTASVAKVLVNMSTEKKVSKFHGSFSFRIPNKNLRISRRAVSRR